MYSGVEENCKDEYLAYVVARETKKKAVTIEREGDIMELYFPSNLKSKFNLFCKLTPDR